MMSVRVWSWFGALLLVVHDVSATTNIPPPSSLSSSSTPSPSSEHRNANSGTQLPGSSPLLLPTTMSMSTEAVPSIPIPAPSHTGPRPVSSLVHSGHSSISTAYLPTMFPGQRSTSIQPGNVPPTLLTGMMVMTPVTASPRQTHMTSSAGTGSQSGSQESRTAAEHSMAPPMMQTVSLSGSSVPVPRSATLVPVPQSASSVPVPQSASSIPVPSSASTTSSPGPASLPLHYQLILYIVPPLLIIVVIAITISLCLCVKRYRRIRRYRLQLLPLHDMDGSDDDSDEEDEEREGEDRETREPVFTLHHQTRPILAFEDPD